MKSRIFFAVIAAVGLTLLLSTSDAEAARYRRARSRSAYRPATTWVTTRDMVTGAYVYPRVVRTDGKTLWDLGKRNGSWPPLR